MSCDITDIQRIIVQPGEVLAVRVPASTSHYEHQKIIDAFKCALPGVAVFVVRGDVEFSVMAQAQEAA